MKTFVFPLIAAVVAGIACSSCAEKPEGKPVAPTSDTSTIPWNTPVAGQGQGQFGLLPQNQYRR